MTTWRDLRRQRFRWKRGALENLIDYGWTRYTAKYWCRQALSLAGILITALYLFSIAQSLVIFGDIHVRLIWLIVTGIFVAEQVITVRSRGWKMQLLAFPLIIEMTYSMYLPESCRLMRSGRQRLSLKGTGDVHPPCGGLLVAMIPAFGVTYVLSNGLYLEWTLLASFTLLAAALALWRIVPRFHKSEDLLTLDPHEHPRGSAWWMKADSMQPDRDRVGALLKFGNGNSDPR